MKQNASKFFQNRACEHFPCHKGIDPNNFNCLFCYCPLYLLGKDCGGSYEYLPNGIKSCVRCALPHGPGGYSHIMEKYSLIADRIREL